VTRLLGPFAIRNRQAIAFVAVALCLAGIYSAFHTPSSVFPRTDFPRVVILVDNGVMPADEMMATITRPIEEAMKDIPGSASVKSATGRGSAEINVFFNWSVDMVQSELYLGPQGEPGPLDAMVNEDFDAVVFNGYWNQYAFHPIRVEADERIRVWVVDDGPSENSAFHIVGTIFDTVWKEGTYLLQPDARRGGSQVLDLQPAQGGFVEFSFAEEGFYPMVTHKFANVGKGALGLFQAGDVELPGSGGGH